MRFIDQLLDEDFCNAARKFNCSHYPDPGSIPGLKKPEETTEEIIERIQKDLKTLEGRLRGNKHLLPPGLNLPIDIPEKFPFPNGWRK